MNTVQINAENYTLTTIGGKEVWINEKLTSTLEVLGGIVKGGFATIKGYVATSGRAEPETADVTFTSAFSTENLYNKEVALLSALTLEEVNTSKVEEKMITTKKKLTMAEQFDICIEKKIASLEKTLSGDRTGAHRQAHDTFYAVSSIGVKCHLSTTKGADGMELVLVNGFPIVNSIQVSCLDVSKRVSIAGVYKKVNSGPKVLMDRAIEKALRAKGLRQFKTRRLSAERFTSLAISKEVITM